MNVIGEKTLYGKHWNSVSLCCKRFEGSSAVDNAPPKQEPLTLVRGFFVASSTNPRQSRTVQDSNRAALRSRVSNQPSGLLLSPRFPTHRNVYRDDCRFVVDGTGLEQQRRRPPPAAETGSRGWGRVLIFQSPAKGLRKNQQTQPVQAPAVRFRQGSQRLGMSIKKDAARPFDLGLFCCAIH